MAHAVDIRKVNAFLKSKGLDPAEFSRAKLDKPIVLKRKQKAKIERLLADDKRVLVYVKRGKVIIRDEAAKFPFEDEDLARKANGLALKKQGNRAPKERADESHNTRSHEGRAHDALKHVAQV